MGFICICLHRVRALVVETQNPGGASRRRRATFPPRSRYTLAGAMRGALSGRTPCRRHPRMRRERFRRSSRRGSSACRGAAFHVLVIVALGITWILDGLEVTLAGSVAPALKESPALRFSDSEVGLAGSAYLLGAVVGALFFGWLTDRLGRKKLFFTTIVVYLVATALTGLAWNGFSFFLFRFLTGCGIGGEYSAINSTIQELVPARFRGHIDLMINGSFWVGAALGALVAVALLNPALIPSEFGWRLAFLTGAVLGVAVFFMRMWIPESPRWLVIHGREKEGEAVVGGIEQPIS